MLEKSTKVICTIGPSIDDEKKLIKMFKCGMDVARLNFSHGSPQTAVHQINRIRNAAKKADKHIAIMLDTKGPEIRVGMMDNDGCQFLKGDVVKLVKEEVIGNKEKIHINCKELFNDVKVGSQLLIDDGKITLQVIGKELDEITCQFLNDGIVKSKKGINVPDVELTMPFISDKDYQDIKFGCEQGVDAFALSFVRTADDILEVKELLNMFNYTECELIAKIESKQAIQNLESIIKVVDGIMVARGDLGVEVAPELVPMYQKQIISLANSYGKFVITATHMLESMIENPRPTRAEASDVANAILDGSDAVMLSGESAVGKYPYDSVQYMVRIASIAESMLDHKALLEKASNQSMGSRNDAVSMAAADIALKMNEVKAIIAFTETGGTPKRIFKYRPRVPIIACTDNMNTGRRLSFYRGVHVVVAKYIDDLSMCDVIAKEVSAKVGLKKGDQIIILVGFAEKHGITNTIRVIELD